MTAPAHDPISEELRALRARAYGPDADIAGDADAIARLRALEVAARPAGEPRPVADEARDVAPAPPSAAEPTVPAPAEEVFPARPAPRLIPRAWLITWAASVAVVAVVTGAIVFSLASIRPVSPPTGATQVASLDDPAAPDRVSWLPQWFGPGAGAVAFEYLGLVVVRARR